LLLISITPASLNLANVLELHDRIIRQLIAQSASGWLELCTRCGQKLIKMSFIKGALLPFSVTKVLSYFWGPWGSFRRTSGQRKAKQR